MNNARSNTAMTPRRLLYVAVAVAAAVLLVLYGSAVFGLNTLSGIRAFVEGEGLWTKHERDAVRHLMVYVDTGESASYEAFQAELDVLALVERSRLELEKEQPDLDVVRDGFLALGLNRRDIGSMVHVFRRFRGLEPVDEAITNWARADAHLAELRTLGQQVRDRSGDGPRTGEALRAELQRIEVVNERLNAAERAFSASLGEAARWTLSLLTRLMLGLSFGAAAVLGGLFVGGRRLIARNEAIADGLVRQGWVREGVTKVYEATEGSPTEKELCDRVTRALCVHARARFGAFYVLEDDMLELRGGYALDEGEGSRLRFSLGAGTVGQAAVDGRIELIDDLPEAHFRFRSGLGESSPRALALLPTVAEGRVNGVIELGMSEASGALEREYLELVASTIGMALAAVRSRAQLHGLLARTQEQAEELQVQQEELRQANESLEHRTRELERTGAALEEQQAELEAVNAELEERTEAQQREARKLEVAHEELTRKAAELEDMSRYKSEFLANMSHELRTPLNSILLLSGVLADNKEGRLTDKDVQYLRTIHGSGEELIKLIDEILDQARIESGQLKLNVERVQLRKTLGQIEQQIRPAAEHKGLEFQTLISPGSGGVIGTDEQRLGQILKNLLSNAIKFTSEGHVHVRLRRASRKDLPPSLREVDDEFVAISVEDTGIGIPADKQQVIFEAFRQADGSTGRRFGGTGLGLAISHRLAGLLGGDLVVESEVGVGSTFTLLLPASETGERVQSSARPVVPQRPAHAEKREDRLPSQPPAPAPDVNPPPAALAPSPGAKAPLDDRDEIDEGSRLLLIVEDDAGFARTLIDLAHERGFKALHANTGEEALALAQRHHPSAVLLDIGLPDMDGLSVIARLKDRIELRHVPVHIVSAQERNLEALRMGAAGYVRKPVNMEQIAATFARIEAILDRPMSRLLVALADEAEGQAIAQQIGGDDVELTLVSTGAAALEALRGGGYDCAVVEWTLPDMTGKEVLLGVRESHEYSHVPVIVLSDDEVSGPDHLAIDRYADRHIIKNDSTPARLLDETTLFLHRVEGSLPPAQRRLIHRMHDRESLFKGRKLLVVDDDMRNVFALSAILEEQGFDITVAKTGVEALRKLDEGLRPDLILMDIMMPEMDGYEATRRIRAREEFSKTPIVALTAKAMKGDRARCIAAGASDYMTKPVDAHKLLSLLRVWLYR